MDKISIMLRILASLFKCAKSIRELSQELEVDVDVIKDIIAFDLKAKSGILDFWKIKLYDGNGEELDEKILEVDHFEDGYVQEYRKLLDDDTIIEIWIDDIKSIDMLSRYERFSLYELLKDSDKEFLKDIKSKITQKLNNEFYNDYIILKDRRLVKHYNDIFDVNIYLINKIFCAIKDRRGINIIKSNRCISYALPLCLIYDNEIDNWYLKYFKKGINYIRLNNIRDIEVLDKKIMLNRSYNEKYITVKIRVFDEKNAKDRAFRYLSRRNIIEIVNGEGYVDITTKVYDLNLFKRWVRALGPSCIILEPKNLRHEFKGRLEEWLKIYNGEG
ncbi:helix-turn-helix transcriptional regulator [Thermobrachium celere]|uniref:helix-turn-helix transcriptional regulator n=1 Tax=Thermobrachium celere TaxID=53422 RepID=UPI001942E957|nr:WYL domain-containing protein [Thermobrachium celere]GFR35907.1 hypothetical protein TCEA9_17190 [Thermobrachium celere]